MGDGDARRNDWGEYLKRIQARPGWSVARLAREAGLHRATIFDWIKGGGESVRVESVLAIAAAVGDHPLIALRAAAGLEDSDDDPEIDEILRSGLPDSWQEELIDSIMRERAQERERRLDNLRRTIRLAKGQTA